MLILFSESQNDQSYQIVVVLHKNLKLKTVISIYVLGNVKRLDVLFHVIFYVNVHTNIQSVKLNSVKRKH